MKKEVDQVVEKRLKGDKKAKIIDQIEKDYEEEMKEVNREYKDLVKMGADVENMDDDDKDNDDKTKDSKEDKTKEEDSKDK